MISDGLQHEIAAAVRGTSSGNRLSGLCVLGIEAVNKECWRVWLCPSGSPGIYLVLATLRSNSAGRAFDLQCCLDIASWRALQGDQVHVLNYVEQVASEFEGPTARRCRRRRREIPVAALPLQFCDPWDRLWVLDVLASRGTGCMPVTRRLVWQHADTLFLAVSWHRVLSAALADQTRSMQR